MRTHIHPTHHRAQLGFQTAPQTSMETDVETATKMIMMMETRLMMSMTIVQQLLEIQHLVLQVVSTRMVTDGLIHSMIAQIMQVIRRSEGKMHVLTWTEMAGLMQMMRL